MAHLMVIFRVFWMKKKLNDFMRVKNIAIDLSQNEIPRITIGDRASY